jgi:uncharacterized membrane protein YoaK (UPF0700 family)
MTETRQNTKEASLAKKDSVPFLLFVLTFVAGLVDAVSFLGLGHVFTANMTGNIVFLGFAAAGAPGLSVIRSLVSLASFLVGAILGGRLAAAFAAANPRRWLFAAGISEVVLLLTAAAASVTFDITSATPVHSLYAVIVLTALAMGLRNASVRKLAVPDMSTTVLTLTLTGLAADSSLAGGNNPRIGRRVASVLLMLAGAAIGTLLLHFGPAMPLLAGGALVLAASANQFIKGDER